MSKIKFSSKSVSSNNQRKKVPKKPESYFKTPTSISHCSSVN